MVNVFQDIGKVVTVWKKFIELRGVIDSSLQGIEDRWAEGKASFSLYGFKLIKILVRL